MKKFLLLALPAMFLTVAVTAQVVVKGLIRSKDGVPLPGATIGIKGTNSFAQADSWAASPSKPVAIPLLRDRQLRRV